MSTPFRERNPVPIGAAGLLAIGLVLFLAFNIQSIPFVGGGDHYRAAFSEAGGLIKGDDVRIAGVKVGKVEKVDLAGNRVMVDFKVTEPVAFGTRTGASVRMKTLLGAKYLALEPAGGGQLKEDSEIPLERTVSSYDIVNAFADLATTVRARSTPTQLAKSLDHAGHRVQGQPARRQGGPGRPQPALQHHRLARRRAQAAARLGQQRQRHDRAAQQGGRVDHQERRPAPRGAQRPPRRHPHAVHQHLGDGPADHRAGARQPHRAQAGPRPAHQGPGGAAEAREGPGRHIAAMGPFTRLFANVLGNGRWFDTYIANLTTPVSAGGN